ncbi:MAG: hypothetical protein D6755_08305, partial [Anaerolineae bacterium]
MKPLRKIILLAVMVLVALAAPLGAARAQDGVRFDTLEVDLWPEYDQPRQTLVIYRIDLPADVQRPVALTLRIPRAAGTPNAVAESQTPTDTLFNVQYSTSQDDRWVYVQFSASMPHIRLEYYDPQLQVDGDQRTVDYTWPGDYAVNNLLIQVQQPRTATQMQITPAMGQPGTNPADGLTYYTASFAALEAGESFSLNVQYQKSDDVLSVSDVPVSPMPTEKSSFSLVDYLPWILGGLGVLLVIGGGVWYWRGTRPEPQKRKRRRKSARVERGEEKTSEGE